MTGVPIDDAVLLRGLAATGIAYGAALLARPRLVAGALCPDFPTDRDWVVRVLGARYVLQDTVVFARPKREVALAAAAVDTLHALSMLPWLGRAPYRRAAAISGATAAVGAVACALLARR